MAGAVRGRGPGALGQHALPAAGLVLGDGRLAEVAERPGPRTQQAHPRRAQRRARPAQGPLPPPHRHRVRGHRPPRHAHPRHRRVHLDEPLLRPDDGQIFGLLDNKVMAGGGDGQSFGY